MPERSDNPRSNRRARENEYAAWKIQQEIFSVAERLERDHGLPSLAADLYVIAARMVRFIPIRLEQIKEGACLDY